MTAEKTEKEYWNCTEGFAYQTETDEQAQRDAVRSECGPHQSKKTNKFFVLSVSGEKKEKSYDIIIVKHSRTEAPGAH